MSAPLHVVQPVSGHGVTRYAVALAAELDAPTADLAAVMATPRRAVHAHVSDALFGATAEEAAGALLALAQRHELSVTLHDVPQPDDGRAFPRRVEAYAAVLAAARGWAVSSEHERALVERHLHPAAAGAVVPLPVVEPPTVASPGLGELDQRVPAGRAKGLDQLDQRVAPAGRAGRPAPVDRPSRPPQQGTDPVVGLLGWVYPGKGHAQVIAACGRLGHPVTVRAVGRVSPGHDALLDELAATAAAAGVRFETTGWVDDADLPAALTRVDVPVCAHRGVSASASLTTWLGARRRPLAVRGDYTAEMARLRPGSLALTDLPGLGAAIAAALAEPETTHLAPEVDLRPHLADTAAGYRAWWATLGAA